MKIKKGDTVKVLIGKDAGRTGRVLKVLPGKLEVVVDGLNLYKKNMKGDNRLKQSAIIDISKPLHISNVMLVCPSCSKPSRVTYTLVAGKPVRMCKKCGKTVEIVKAVESAKKDEKKSKTGETKESGKKVEEKKKVVSKAKK